MHKQLSFAHTHPFGISFWRADSSSPAPTLKGYWRLPITAPPLELKGLGLKLQCPSGVAIQSEAIEEGSQQPRCEIWGWGNLVRRSQAAAHQGGAGRREKQGAEMGRGSPPAVLWPAPQAPCLASTRCNGLDHLQGRGVMSQQEVSAW